MKLAQINFYQAAENKLPGVDQDFSQLEDRGFGNLLSGLLSGVMVIGALMVLLYLVWGAIEWITSAGDKGKAEKARDKMTQAMIGLIILGATLAIFGLLQAFLGISVFNFSSPATLTHELGRP